jgi:hypothetical protein
LWRRGRVSGSHPCARRCSAAQATEGYCAWVLLASHRLIIPCPTGSYRP